MSWFAIRFSTLALVLVGTVCTAMLAVISSLAWLWAAIPLAALALLGLYDLAQPHHAIRRNYPILGNLRFLFEAIRPEIRQYFLRGRYQRHAFFTGPAFHRTISAPKSKWTSALSAPRKRSTTTAMNG